MSYPANHLLKHFLLALSKGGQITYSWDNDDTALDEEAKNLDDDTTAVVGVNLEQCTRDLFYGAKGALEIVKKSLQEYESENDKTFSLAKHLNVNNAEAVFCSSKLDDNGEDHEIWLASRSDDPSQNWLLGMTAFVGEYCDEDYDLNITLDLATHISKQEIDTKVSSVASRWIQEQAAGFEHQLDNIKKNLPASLAHTFDEQLLSSLKKFAIFQPVLAHKQNAEISDAVQSVTKTKRSRQPKI